MNACTRRSVKAIKFSKVENACERSNADPPTAARDRMTPDIAFSGPLGAREGRFSLCGLTAGYPDAKLAGPRLGVRPRARCYPAAELDRAPACTRLRQIVLRQACSSADQPARPGGAVVSGAQRLITSCRVRIRTRST